MENLVLSTKTQYVYNGIRENIISGAYPAGTTLRLNKISKEFNISEQPVREALAALQAECLVTTIPHTGTIVNAVNHDEMKEAYEIRAFIESYYVDKNIMNYTDQDIADLSKCIEEMQDSLVKSDVFAFHKAHSRFHEILVASASDLVKSSLNLCWNKIRFTMNERSIGEIRLTDHMNIFEAIKMKNKKLAHDTLYKHIISSIKLSHF